MAKPDELLSSRLPLRKTTKNPEFEDLDPVRPVSPTDTMRDIVKREWVVLREIIKNGKS